jgi:fibro-slime domain-containing protein
MALRLGLRFLVVCLWSLAACSGDGEDVRGPVNSQDGAVRDGAVTSDGGDGDGDGGANRDGGRDGGGKEEEGCGDGAIQSGEVCDDANNLGGDGCAPDCKAMEPLFACPMPGEPCVSTVRCGNGVIEGGEECDDANRNFKDGCNKECKLEAGWVCPVPGSRCQAKVCGDGLIAGKEQCEDDDGATPMGGDGCSATCMLEPPDWACDTAGAACRKTVCNDGIKEGSEPCDDGNQIIGDGCNPFCQVEPNCSGGACQSRCGDGLLLPNDPEECDDGNTKFGDGCSATCQVEDGWGCTTVTGSLPMTLNVPVVYRDFIHRANPGATKHADFQSFSGDGTPNLVLDALGPTGKPVFAGICDGDGSYPDPLCPDDQQLTTMANFDQWYNDTPGVNRTIVTTMALGETAPGSGAYQISNGAFFPLNSLGWMSDATERNNDAGDLVTNYGFTSEIRTWFEYKGGETLSFSGDDDVWVFINGKLAVDLGGLHGPLSDSVTLAMGGDATFNLTVGNVYEIVLFHAERRELGSNFDLTLAGFVSAKSECTTDCGDSIVAGDEECDDGVNDGSYGSCTLDCKRGPFCGDAIKQDPPEVCDVGANLVSYSNDGEGCAPGCAKPGACGDGVVDGLFEEQCDDGDDNADGYGECQTDCTLGARCGDETVQANEDEQCDDGNLVKNDGCDDKCQLEAPE